MIKIIFGPHEIATDFEIVERKGIGHPDTLADALAEELSRAYSNYTFTRFGAVLHHNFDKLGLLGGKSRVSFGSGILISPIRILVNGRASLKFGEEKIPVEELLDLSIKTFFSSLFPNLDPIKDLQIQYNFSTASSPGHSEEIDALAGTRKYWFEPRNLNDLKELKYLSANDSSIGCGFAPMGALDAIILQIESSISCRQYKSDKPWLGSDIKILGLRTGNTVHITMCIPQIADYVNSVETYKNNIEIVKKDIIKIINQEPKFDQVELAINTRDDFVLKELYLTAIGSSIESGDEGLVGRGNRINGLITPMQPMSIEGACGKNPVYHVGKLYNIAARNIAERIFQTTNFPAKVFLVSQSGQSLLDPWQTIILTEKKAKNSIKEIQHIANEELKKIPEITKKLLKGEVQLY